MVGHVVVLYARDTCHIMTFLKSQRPQWMCKYFHYFFFFFKGETYHIHSLIKGREQELLQTEQKNFESKS
jgi:hypothetical protein